jgi:sulfur-oxidizing protein SoxY
MSDPQKILNLDRRSFVAGASAAAAIATFLGSPSRALAETGFDAEAAGNPPAAAQSYSQAFHDALAKVLGEAKPAEAGLTLELPELAENGNTVPYKLAIDSPMTDTDYIKAMHLLSTANPQAVVGSFYLVPASGKAQVAGRMRLARTQDVVAVAERSNGEFAIATRRVEVTIGGCGNE